MEHQFENEKRMFLAWGETVRTFCMREEAVASAGYFPEKEHLHFLKRVRSGFPCLTQDDLLIMWLMRMSVRNVEIARLLHVQPASFRLRRWRLKKKLGITTDLRTFVMSL